MDKRRTEGGNGEFSDKPASALFAHDKHKIACLSIRGTATIQDVVTDIRAMPVPFPQPQEEEEVPAHHSQGPHLHRPARAAGVQDSLRVHGAGPLQGQDRLAAQGQGTGQGRQLPGEGDQLTAKKCT